jgi:hypothetical protein
MKRRFTSPLVRKLKAEVRKDVERQRGQLVLLDNIDAIEKAVKAAGYKPTRSQMSKALKAGKTEALRLQNNFIAKDPGARRFRSLEQKFPTINFKAEKIKLGENAFLVSSFRRSVNSIRDAMLKSLQTDLGFSDTERTGTIGKAIHKGHGEEGLAVSQVKVATAFSRAAELEGGVSFLADNLAATINGADIDSGHKKKHIELMEELSMQYFNVVTKSGKLRADYFSIITFQSSGDNIEDSKIEAEFVRILRSYVDKKFAEDLVTEFEGSSTIKDKIEGAIMDSFKNGPNVKVTKGGSKPGTVSRGEIKHKNSQPKVVGKIVRAPKKQIKQRNVPSSNPLSLLTLLNSKLQDTVIKNMGPPALTNRTGRFAQSVRVTDITKTPQGFPSIGYTYMKDPYQVFEVSRGTLPWGTPQRDPRRLIDMSIREIAAEYLQGRFFTRRI